MRRRPNFISTDRVLGAFNQERVLVGTFSVINFFEALVSRVSTDLLGGAVHPGDGWGRDSVGGAAEGAPGVVGEALVGGYSTVQFSTVQCSTWWEGGS